MNAIESLRNRRTRLLIEAALQRERIGHDLRTLQAPLSVVDHGVEALRWLNKRRLAALTAGAALAITRPRMLLRWARRGLIGWQTWRSLSGLMKTVLESAGKPR